MKNKYFDLIDDLTNDPTLNNFKIIFPKKIFKNKIFYLDCWLSNLKIFNSERQYKKFIWSLVQEFNGGSTMTNKKLFNFYDTFEKYNYDQFLNFLESEQNEI